MQTPRAKQRSSLAGGEPARGLPIAPPALAAEEQQPQPDAGEQQPTRPLRLTRAAVLGEEVQLSADVLGEEPAAVRGAADVHHLGAGEEVDAPAGLAEAVAPVGLLAEHEEVLVEHPHLLHGLAPDEHASAHHELRLPHGVVVEPARIEGIERARPRAELAQEEVLRREAPHGREAAHRPLQRAVRVEQLRPDDRGLRVRLGEGGELLDRVADGPGVRVEKQEIAARGHAHARVRAGAEAGVPLLDQPRLREAAAHELERPVGRAVVDDDRLVPAHALEAPLQPGQRVVGDDDDADFSHRGAAAGWAE